MPSLRHSPFTVSPTPPLSAQCHQTGHLALSGTKGYYCIMYNSGRIATSLPVGSKPFGPDRNKKKTDPDPALQNVNDKLFLAFLTKQLTKFSLKK